MRWKSLRDAYVKEMKQKNALINGDDSKRRRNWRYSDCMSFLLPFVSPANSSKGVRRRKHLEGAVEFVEEVEPVENFFVTLEDLKEVPEDGYNESAVNEWTDHPPDKKCVVSPDGYQESDIDSFFKGIADTVKKLNPVNQVKIQRDIVNMVLDVKLKEIEGSKDPVGAH